LSLTETFYIRTYLLYLELYRYHFSPIMPISRVADY